MIGWVDRIGPIGLIGPIGPILLLPPVSKVSIGKNGTLYDVER